MSWHSIDISGKKFGRLTPIRPTIGRRWIYRCDCGEQRELPLNVVLRGVVISCGCFMRENNSTHKLSKHPLYQTWSAMLGRCYNMKNPAFKKYGGRGITVCDRWRHSISNFISDMGEKPKGTSLERIDNDGPYSPDNCKWATAMEQAQNRRSSSLLTFKGRTLPVMQWSREIGIKRTTIEMRLLNGWSIEKALSTPVRSRLKRKSSI